jgi:hypothetical protein
VRNLFILCASLALTANMFAVDLSQHYQATLDFFEGQPTREWTCTKDDVWALKSFRYSLDDQLTIELGPSHVVFGVHDKNVVWAAVIPEKPGTVSSKLAGNGDEAASIWMRFNPVHLATLFPDETVIGQGPESIITLGKRMCAWKIQSGWQANNLPVIPKQSSIVLDVDTPELVRHYYLVDLDLSKVDYIAAFTSRPLPALVAFTSEQSLRAFDTVWHAFDTEYAKFIIRPELDWKAAGEKNRQRAAEAKSNYEAAAAISAMIEELKDLHAWVKVGDEFIPGYNRPRPLNVHMDAVRRQTEGWSRTNTDLVWARTSDNIGYINIHALNKKSLVGTFDEVLEALNRTWGLIIDLRLNGGGDELLARQMAGRFLDEKRVYSMSQYRSGPNHNDLGPKQERPFEPRGPWRYQSPVVVLIGQKTMSSAESFALMLAQCPKVTTMGDRTAGSSGNPRNIALEGKIMVNLPRWIDLDEKGNSIEDVGIAPDVVVDAKPEEFSPMKDPVFDRAVEHLRKIPDPQRVAGKRQ